MGKRTKIYTDMADALRGGESLMDYLEKRHRRAVARKNPMAPLFALWVRNLGQSGKFSEAVKESVPTMDTMIINSAEITGKLDQGLAFLAQTVEKSQKMRAAVISAISMPAFLCCLLIAILCGFTFFMVPILTAVIPPDKWPTSGKFLYKTAMFIQSYGIFLFIGGVSGIAGFTWSLPNWIHGIRLRMDAFLPYSIYRDTNGAIFLVTLASLLKSGISVGDSLKIMRDYAGPWMKLHLSRMIWKLDRESSAAKALNTGLLSYELFDRVEDYGERASFQEAIERIGFEAIDIVTQKVTSAAAFLNTLGLLFVGGNLGFIIFSVLTTAQQAQRVIQGSM